MGQDCRAEVDCEFRQIDSSPGPLIDSAIEELTHQAGEFTSGGCSNSKK